MAKRGRPKRRAADRYPCGQPRPVSDGPTDEHKEQRHALVGADEKRQRYAAYALGVLYMHQPPPGEPRYITSDQHYAGWRYAAMYSRGVRPLTLPSVLGNLVAGGGYILTMAGIDDGRIAGEERGAQDRLDYLLVRKALDRAGARAAAAVDDLVVHDHGPTTQARLDDIRRGLDALHSYFEAVDARSRAAQA